MSHLIQTVALTIIFTITITITTTVAAFADTPQTIIKSAIDRVLLSLNDESLKSPGKAKERRAKIRAIFDERFDVEEMSKRALSVNWEKRTDAEKKEFVPLFGNLIVNTYIGRIEKYSGEAINYAGEQVDGNYAEVKTEVNAKDGGKIPINYYMLNKNNEWKVYDVSIEGVRLVNNYRSQFASIINTKSYEELVKLLKEKKSAPDER
ncbi:MAG: ABC transporter substrate-binding protein [Nitrospirae bacterium]|nr:ABC transporter substrate-binding protein [Nitrospirota bacterium]